MNNINWQETSEFKEAEDSNGFLLWKVSCRWRRSVEISLKKLGLTHPQFVILACTAWLTKDKHLVSQADIAKQSNIDIVTTSQIIRGLEKKRYLYRKRRAEDERAKYPILTKEGADILAQALPTVEAIDRSFFASLHDKATDFNKLLRILI